MADTWLVADLGGTNTRVALAGPEGLVEESAERVANAGFEGLAPLLAAYLARHAPGPISALCAGVAGPVRGGTAQLTNHAWFIDGAELAALTGAGAVHLLNDLQAQGYALDDLPQGAARPLLFGQSASEGAARLVLNLGTGCNVAAVHRISGRLFVPAAESGHSALPHASGEMAALFDHLRDAHPHLPVEAVLSGPGLARLHAFLTGTERTPAQIVAEAETGGARASLALFSRVLGAVAGNIALHHLPMGGLYLSGGLSPALAPHLDKILFEKEFSARGPYTEIVRAIPVSVLDDPFLGLRGCARYLRQYLP
ncbi:MAG: glucokinase [Roseovarius sp.]